MTDLHLTSKRPKVLLVGCYLRARDLPVCEEHLDELSRLVDTYGADTAGRAPCSLRAIDRSTYLGKGKIEELKAEADMLDVDAIIWDEELSPGQQRNLEEVFKRDVLERREVILGVFQKHARTKEAHLQVELAQVRYELPRLKRLWTHLSRQRGGGLAVKGAGEKQIELDRRMLTDKAAHLTAQLKEVQQHRKTQRQAREKAGIPTFAIVGYTNAGKSTLLNALTEAGVLVEDQLFATLDTTTRKYVLPNKQEILLIDTVGFIRKLPHQLVAAFKSTLDEAVYADILLHVIDASSSVAHEQGAATLEVLKELGAAGKPTLTLLNKCDAADPNMVMRLRTLHTKTVQISAKEGTGFKDLAERMMAELAALRQEVRLRIPQAEYALVSELIRSGEVIDQEYEENDILLHIRIPSVLVGKVEPYLVS
jgi:GTPase